MANQDDSDSSESALAPVAEAAPIQVFEVGDGTKLIYRASVDYKLTEEIQSITPEMSAHQLALARIEAEKEIKIAELQHVVPVKLMVKPLWVAAIALGTSAIVAVCLGNELLAAAAITGLALAPLVEAISKKIRKSVD
jgi:hypothetical protein